MKIGIRPLALLTCSLLLLAITSLAQDFRATITGRITDASKAAIPNAQVRVKNTGTNETITMSTDSEGNYKVPFLRPGSYSVTVEAAGFKKSIREAIELVISQVATIDFSLETGSISEQVTGSGSALHPRAQAEGWEGLIAKRRDSPYEHRRSKHWLKMKCEASQEFVVGGFTDPQGARVGLGALLVGYYDGGEFVFAGKIDALLDE